MGVTSGCGCKELHRFSHITYPYSSCICSFLQQHPTFFVHFFNVSRSCFCTFYGNFNIFFTQYKHTYG